MVQNIEFTYTRVPSVDFLQRKATHDLMPLVHPTHIHTNGHHGKHQWYNDRKTHAGGLD